MTTILFFETDVGRRIFFGSVEMFIAQQKQIRY